MPIELDEVDVALLAAVQRDARVPQAALGARVGLSAAAVNRRLRRLTDAGIIDRTTMVLAPEPLGVPLTVVVTVEVVSEQLELLDQVERALAACPQVQQCYYVTGEWDFVAVMLVTDMAQFTRLTRQLFFADHNVKRFKSLVVMRAAKVSLDVPLPAPGAAREP